MKKLTSIIAVIALASCNTVMPIVQGVGYGVHVGAKLVNLINAAKQAPDEFHQRAQGYADLYCDFKGEAGNSKFKRWNNLAAYAVQKGAPLDRVQYVKELIDRQCND